MRKSKLNPKIFNLLKKKTKGQISDQAIRNAISQIRRNVPSLTLNAAAEMFAKKRGFTVVRYLSEKDRETMKNIRITEIKIPAKKKKKQMRTIIIPNEFKLDDPLLSIKKLNEAKEMASIYPFLYVLENSIRELIDKVMISKYGKDWFTAKAPKGLQDKVKNRMKDEKKNAWHQRRGTRPIDYLDLNQLCPLTRKIEKEVIPDIIPSLEWFQQFIEEIYKSRCVMCHMNPLDKDNIQAVKLRFKQWQKQIKEKKDLIS